MNILRTAKTKEPLYILQLPHPAQDERNLRGLSQTYQQRCASPTRDSRSNSSSPWVTEAFSLLFRNLRVPFANGLAIWRPIFRHPRPAVQGQAVDATAAIGLRDFYD